MKNHAVVIGHADVGKAEIIAHKIAERGLKITNASELAQQEMPTMHITPNPNPLIEPILLNDGALIHKDGRANRRERRKKNRHKN